MWDSALLPTMGGLQVNVLAKTKENTLRNMKKMEVKINIDESILMELKEQHPNIVENVLYQIRNNKDEIRMGNRN